MAAQQTEWDARGRVVPEARPSRPEPKSGVVPEPPTAQELFVQRLGAGLLVLTLLSVNALLWGIDGAFRILFLVFTAWVIFDLWSLVARRPRG